MSDTAPHFIDSANTTAQATLDKAADVTRQTVDVAKDTASAVAGKTAEAAARVTDAATKTGARSFTALSEANKALTAAVTQSLSEMNALTQQAMRIRSPQDFLEYQTSSIAHFQNNLSALGNIYSALWLSASDSVYALAGKAQEAGTSLRQAA
jgi:cell division septum initiation protein DivIVA